MEMPKTEEESKLLILTPDGVTWLTQLGLGNQKFDTIGVPPHGRLIDADALMNEGWTLHKQTMWMGNCATHVISLDNPNVPTVIPADKDGET